MTVAAVAGVLLIVVALLLVFQRSMIYIPRRYDPIDLHSLPQDAATLQYETKSGLQYTYYLPPRHAGTKDLPERLWVVFGGNAMRALDWLDFIEKARTTGTAFLLVDYPGYGQSAGSPSRRTIAAASEAAFQGLASYLNTRPDLLEQKLNILGLSIGSAVGLDFAVKHPVGKVILLAPFTSLLDMARRSVGTPLCYLLYDRYDNRARLSELVARANPPKISIFHGDADEIVPFQMGRELATIAPKAIEFHAIHQAGHNSLLQMAEGPILRAIFD